MNDGGADLAQAPGDEPYRRVHQGIVLPVFDVSGDWLEVTTTCNDRTWVRRSEVTLTTAASPVMIGPGADLTQMVVVLDPGHGDRDWGAVGPTNLGEKAVNLDVALRTRDLLESARSVDWDSGRITAGDDYPPLGAVVLTRDPLGPNNGDFELGLGHRADVANAAGAHAFVSIHNNAVPNRDTDLPGTEVFYSVAEPRSTRLAGILYEEMIRSFRPYEVDWMGGDIQGARARIDESGDDYYGLLARARVPAVIVEGLYLTNPDEEQLLRTDEARQAYAEALYRGLIRFLTTDDGGSSINPPEVFTGDAGTVDSSRCVVPPQR